MNNFNINNLETYEIQNFYHKFYINIKKINTIRRTKHKLLFIFYINLMRNYEINFY